MTNIIKNPIQISKDAILLLEIFTRENNDLDDYLTRIGLEDNSEKYSKEVRGIFQKGAKKIVNEISEESCDSFLDCLIEELIKERIKNDIEFRNKLPKDYINKLINKLKKEYL